MAPLMMLSAIAILLANKIRQNLAFGNQDANPGSRNLQVVLCTAGWRDVHSVLKCLSFARSGGYPGLRLTWVSIGRSSHQTSLLAASWEKSQRLVWSLLLASQCCRFLERSDEAAVHFGVFAAGRDMVPSTVHVDSAGDKLAG